MREADSEGLDVRIEQIKRVVEAWDLQDRDTSGEAVDVATRRGGGTSSGEDCCHKRPRLLEGDDTAPNAPPDADGAAEPQTSAGTGVGAAPAAPAEAAAAASGDCAQTAVCGAAASGCDALDSAAKKETSAKDQQAGGDVAPTSELTAAAGRGAASAGADAAATAANEATAAAAAAAAAADQKPSTPPAAEPDAPVVVQQAAVPVRLGDLWLMDTCLQIAENDDALMPVCVPQALVSAWFNPDKLPYGICLLVEGDGKRCAPRFPTEITESYRISYGLDTMTDLAGCRLAAFRRAAGPRALDLVLVTTPEAAAAVEAEAAQQQVERMQRENGEISSSNDESSDDWTLELDGDEEGEEGQEDGTTVPLYSPASVISILSTSSKGEEEEDTMVVGSGEEEEWLDSADANGAWADAASSSDGESVVTSDSAGDGSGDSEDNSRSLWGWEGDESSEDEGDSRRSGGSQQRGPSSAAAAADAASNGCSGGGDSSRRRRRSGSAGPSRQQRVYPELPNGASQAAGRAAAAGRRALDVVGGKASTRSRQPAEPVQRGTWLVWIGISLRLLGNNGWLLIPTMMDAWFPNASYPMRLCLVFAGTGLSEAARTTRLGARVRQFARNDRKCAYELKCDKKPPLPEGGVIVQYRLVGQSTLEVVVANPQRAPAPAPAAARTPAPAAARAAVVGASGRAAARAAGPSGSSGGSGGAVRRPAVTQGNSAAGGRSKPGLAGSHVQQGNAPARGPPAAKPSAAQGPAAQRQPSAPLPKRPQHAQQQQQQQQQVQRRKQLQPKRQQPTAAAPGPAAAPPPRQAPPPTAAAPPPAAVPPPPAAAPPPAAPAPVLSASNMAVLQGLLPVAVPSQEDSDQIHDDALFRAYEEVQKAGKALGLPLAKQDAVLRATEANVTPERQRRFLLMDYGSLQKLAAAGAVEPVLRWMDRMAARAERG